MTTIEMISDSEQETKEVAALLAKYVNAGDVITLAGDLGAGKTTFTKGLAEGLQIKRTVTSPTFTIVKEYAGTLPLYHMDAYRLEYSDEDIGFDEYFYGDGVSVIEWATFIEEYLPTEHVAITIERMGETSRKIVFRATGTRYEQLLAQVKKAGMGRFWS